jgi:hypothetical protein
MNLKSNQEESIVIAPRERSSQIEKYLAMAMASDRATATTREPDVYELLEKTQGQASPVVLGASSTLHLDGLRCLAKSIREDPYYDDFGKRLGSNFVYQWILKYLQFERDLAKFPDIAKVPVPQALFIVGFGRTGSTFLHHLMALDSTVRAPRLWELMEPSPPPTEEAYTTDPRIRRVQMHLSTRSILMPNMHKIHEYDVRAPEECQHMMWHGPHHAMLGLKGTEYLQWFDELSDPDLRVLYEAYKLQVQHLQLFHRKERWVSKSLTHAYFLPVLFKVFPNARVVRLHRDPCEIIPALASLTAHLQVIYTRRSDFDELGQRMLRIFAESMRRSMLADETAGSERLIDVLFADLIKDPVRVIRNIYAKCGYPYTDDFDSALRKHLRASDHHRKYKHVYRLEQFGLSRAKVMSCAEPYLEWVERKTGSMLSAA